MVKVLAYMFLTVKAQRVADVLEQARDMGGVRAAHAVTGRHDIVLQLQADNFTTLANEVLPQLRAIDGVETSETAIVIEEPKEEL